MAVAAKRTVWKLTGVMLASRGMDEALARRMHKLVEPCHSFAYFAPETKDIYAAAGLKGQWMGYFASRSAAMGAVPAEVVIATFYSFAPALVARAIPDAWVLSTPKAVLEARYEVADQALRRILSEGSASPEIAEAATLARAAIEDCDPAGRPLYAGHCALDWPDAPHLALWHAATLLREFRGDGHLAALVTEELGPREALLMQVAVRPDYLGFVENFRGWTAEELGAARDGLRGRGLIDGEGLATDEGRTVLQRVEDRTDRLALAPWRALGAERVERLAELLAPVRSAITGR